MSEKLQQESPDVVVEVLGEVLRRLRAEAAAERTAANPSPLAQFFGAMGKSPQPPSTTPTHVRLRHMRAYRDERIAAGAPREEVEELQRSIELLRDPSGLEVIGPAEPPEEDQV